MNNTFEIDYIDPIVERLQGKQMYFIVFLN